MKVTLVGGGKVGYYLAKALLEHGHEPTMIERDKKTCAFLANDLDIPIFLGDGTQIETLSNARVGESDAVICVTGTDEGNLIACQLAKNIFHVAKTIAKVNNPKNADALKQLGVDHVINSTHNIVFMLEHEVDASKIRKLIQTHDGTASICEIQLPEKYAMEGVQLKNLMLPEDFSILTVTRKGSLIIPRGYTELRGGDTIMIIARLSEVYRLNELLKLDEEE